MVASENNMYRDGVADVGILFSSLEVAFGVLICQRFVLIGALQHDTGGPIITSFRRNRPKAVPLCSISILVANAP